jgi:hypothetical protein
MNTSDYYSNAIVKALCYALRSKKNLGESKTRFFAIVKAYRLNPETFSIVYLRSSSPKLSEQAEKEVKHELLHEKDLTKDPRLPIVEYNYSALRDRLREKDIQVPVPTIIERAKRFDCYKHHHYEADVHPQALWFNITEFENYTNFSPTDLHEKAITILRKYLAA